MAVTNTNLQVRTINCGVCFIAQDRDHGASVDLNVDLTQSRERQFGGAQALFKRRLSASGEEKSSAMPIHREP